ncbi:MAG: LysR family transcriptional regulator [Syntrophaceae bacterium]|nr:LysR family transcriptional regulator [Syntrophaceae bacterium]
MIKVMQMNTDHLKNITLQQMEALICVAEEGSFSLAAKKMHLTQPALTKNIRNAEDYLSAHLVNRSNSGITLTPEGKIIYDYARRMIKLREEAKEKINAFGANTGGHIYIGASTIPSTYILPRMLSALRVHHPDITMYIKTADSEDVMNMVLAGEVEMGIIGKCPSNKKLEAQELWKDRLILAVPKKHKWSKTKSLAMKELFAEPFIVREKGSATRDFMENYLKEEKSVNLSQFNICAELGSSEAVKEAIIAGLGVSIISIHAVERELAQGLLMEIPIQGCLMERNFYLTYKKQTDLRAFHKTFINFLK